MWKQEQPVQPVTPQVAGTTSPASAKENSANQNVSIGKSIVVKGELHGSEDLTIEGQVEGKITWVRLFFVGGPRGFCQRHGKSYLTRRRCGGEGGGGGLLTGRAIPSAYRWAWCRWYSRVVEVPVRIEVAAGFVAPGASEPPRLQPSSPPGGSGPAHG